MLGLGVSGYRANQTAVLGVHHHAMYNLLFFNKKLLLCTDLLLPARLPCPVRHLIHYGLTDFIQAPF